MALPFKRGAAQYGFAYCALRASGPVGVDVGCEKAQHALAIFCWRMAFEIGVGRIVEHPEFFRFSRGGEERAAVGDGRVQVFGTGDDEDWRLEFADARDRAQLVGCDGEEGAGGGDQWPLKRACYFARNHFDAIGCGVANVRIDGFENNGIGFDCFRPEQRGCAAK